jgi:RHS repeat-associated protein
MPFGGKRGEGTGITASNYLFTDQELDKASGLYNYDARLYDPIIGRFASADPIVQAPFYSQSFNRYAYVQNNPLIYIDPSGYESSENDDDADDDADDDVNDPDEDACADPDCDCEYGIEPAPPGPNGIPGVSVTLSETRDTGLGGGEGSNGYGAGAYSGPPDLPAVEPFLTPDMIIGFSYGISKAGILGIGRLGLRGLATKSGLPKSFPIPRSVGAMSRAEKLARQLKLNVNSPTTRQVLNSLDDKVVDFVGKFRSGSIKGKLPGEVMDMTVKDALKHSTTVRKLLIDNRFVK